MAQMGPPLASYKIVKCKAGKSQSFSLVPASWEVNGVLSWPKLKSDNKFNNFVKKHVAPGTPAGVEWTTCTAKVVETNIIDYDVGNARLSVLLKQNDSSSSATNIEDTIPVKRRRTTKTNVSEKNYSAMFSKQTTATTTTTSENHDNDNILGQSAPPADNSRMIVNTPESTIPVSSANNVNDTVNEQSNERTIALQMSDGTTRQYVLGDNNLLFAIEGEVKQKPDCTNQQYSLDENNQLTATENSVQFSETVVNKEQSTCFLAEILANVNVLTDEVRKIRAELGESTKKVDEMHDVLIRGINVGRIVKNRSMTTQFHFEPIGSDVDAKMVENLLESNEYEEALMAHFIEDRASSSNLKGNNVPFDLVDKIFTRKFFDNVSWTGVMKKSSRIKTCFSQFVRIRKFFFKLCHSVDKNYSMPMCDDWLKNVAIRTSGARMLAKGTRASRTKSRKSTRRRLDQSLTDGDDDESAIDNRLDEQAKVDKTFVPDRAQDGTSPNCSSIITLATPSPIFVAYEKVSSMPLTDAGAVPEDDNLQSSHATSPLSPKTIQNSEENNSDNENYRDSKIKIKKVSKVGQLSTTSRNNIYVLRQTNVRVATKAAKKYLE